MIRCGWGSFYRSFLVMGLVVALGGCAVGPKLDKPAGIEAKGYMSTKVLDKTASSPVAGGEAGADDGPRLSLQPALPLR